MVPLLFQSTHWITSGATQIQPLPVPISAARDACWGLAVGGEQLQHLAPKSYLCLRMHDVRQKTNQHALCTNHQWSNRRWFDMTRLYFQCVFIYFLFLVYVCWTERWGPDKPSHVYTAASLSGNNCVIQYNPIFSIFTCGQCLWVIKAPHRLLLCLLRFI